MQTITRVVLFARGRDLLARAVQGLVANQARHGRRADLTVFDDHQAGGVDPVLAHLTSIRRWSGVPIRYSGIEEKTRFAEALVASSHGRISPETVRFALFGLAGGPPALGANRNASLLESVDALSLSVDEGVVPLLGRIPGSAPGWRITPEDDPTEWWMHPDRSSVLSSIAIDEQDVLGLHEGMLGKTMVELAALEDPLHLGRPDGAFIAPPTDRVAATMVGLAGDADIRDPIVTRPLSTASRRRLLESAVRYSGLKTSREAVCGPTMATMTRGPGFKLPCVGLDHRFPLPPFVPVGPDEGALFSTALVHARGDAWLAHLPWAVIHTPELRGAELAPSARSAWFRGDEPTIGHVIDRVLRAAPRETSPWSWMRSVGEELIQVATCPTPGVRLFVDTLLREDAHARIAELGALLDRHHRTPGHWARDIEHCIDRLSARTASAEPLEPSDIGFVDADPERATAKVLGHVGALFREWPDIVDAARELSAAGLKPSREVPRSDGGAGRFRHAARDWTPVPR